MFGFKELLAGVEGLGDVGEANHGVMGFGHGGLEGDEAGSVGDGLAVGGGPGQGFGLDGAVEGQGEALPEYFRGVDGRTRAVVAAEIGGAQERRDKVFVGEILSEEGTVGAEFGAGEGSVARQRFEHSGLREVVFAEAFIFVDECLFVLTVDPHEKEDAGQAEEARGHVAVDHFYGAKDVPSHDERHADRGEQHGDPDSPTALAVGDVGQR